MDTLSKLGPRFVEDLSKLKATIDAYQKQRHDLRYYADFYEGAPFHRRDFVLNGLNFCGKSTAGAR